ncbi:hypothetical protein A0U93_14785 [Neoasaia chiangmaiensis]|uniref:Uncharacterized protein n=1 Tax=Neoasaia chiangmaiensis TaxID=320497 RepID=A0A1U9KSZ1_9PROT|nr:hypothetical protein A0U93_14785 [Neoasaia chiangmaiensis]
MDRKAGCSVSVAGHWRIKDSASDGMAETREIRLVTMWPETPASPSASVPAALITADINRPPHKRRPDAHY